MFSVFILRSRRKKTKECFDQRKSPKSDQGVRKESTTEGITGIGGTRALTASLQEPEALLCNNEFDLIS